MRTFIRSAGVVALVAANQMLAPLVGQAQVDPCHPVPIPELCEVIEPSPSPGPSPSTSPSPKGEKPGKADHVDKPSKSQAGAEEEAAADKNRKKKEKLEQGATTPRGNLVISSPNNSAAVVETLTPLARYGLNIHEALLRVVGPFPISGLAYWTDDWGACRDGCSRSHEGLDIFAKEGTPLVATADGVVTQKLVGELSGISIEIQDANGIQYFYAHMSAWAEPINVGDPVQVGQVLGYVGNSGNAITTPHHVHLEIQPGGVPAPPKPLIDRWVKIAELEAQALAARVMAKEAPEASNFRVTRQFDLGGGAQVLDPGAEQLLALAGIQPSVSSLEMARRLLGQMSWEIDWAGQTDAQLAELAQQATTLTAAVDLSGATPWAPFGVAPTSTTSTGVGLPEQGD